jgi:Sec-independent protein translocase protein TatA
MKVLVALRVPGTDVRDVIQVHRRYLVQLMQQWTRIKESEGESDLSLALVVDAELFRLDAVVRWLDAADGRIKRAAADPARADKTQADKTRADQAQADQAQADQAQADQTTGTTQAMPSVRRRIGARK